MNNKRNPQLDKDNRGSGLIMVLIMVAFLGILTAILMVATYGGYKMRLADKQNKDNFYSVEAVLDEINVGLQEKASDALAIAYQDIMVNYSRYETPQKRTTALYTTYFEQLQKELEKSSTESDQYKVDLLIGFLSDRSKGDGDGSRGGFQTYGAIVESNLDTGKYPLSLMANGIYLKDLKVTYVNEKGIVSIISTDIRIALPQVDFSESSAFPDLEQYCMIADQGIKAGNSVVGGEIVFTGNLYADSVTLGKQQGTVSHDGAFSFIGSNISFQKPVANPLQEVEPLVVSKKDITVKESAIKVSAVDLWSGEIVLDSADAELTGNTFVQNDLKLEGNGSKAKIAGTYTGFGTALDQANASSAIVINGKNSSLDLSATTSLNVSGHTYVGTSVQELVPQIHGTDGKKTDVLMGESIAVKSNQLIYLVPPEALGCAILSDGVSIGESVYRSNPMKMSQYEELKNNPDKYVMINASRNIVALGGHTLSEYMQQEAIAGTAEGEGTPTVDYRPIVIVKQNGAGESLVYCYMKFKDEKAANRYFRDYYGVNEEKVKKYTKVYADAIKMPQENPDLLYLHLAGNVLAYQEDTFSVKDATDDTSEKLRAGQLALMREDMFKALTTKMVTNIASVTIAEQGRTVFENIIDDQKLTETVDGLKATPGSNQAMIYSADHSQAVLLCTGNYTIDGTQPSEVRMVICLGDVRVKQDFHGLIIAGGEIVVGDENDMDKKVEITNLSMEDYTQLLNGMETNGGTDYYVLDVFRDGRNHFAASGSGAVSDGTQEVVLEDLIIYERWSKK